MRTIEVSEAVQSYMEGLLAPRDALLTRMEDEAERENIPIVGPHEGALLTLLIKLGGCKRILELGTATGYSGLCLLRGSGGGSLTTYELDPVRAERARQNFAAAGAGMQALVLEQDAVKALEELESRFDACFIDLLNSFPSEDVTQRVLELCLARLDEGALLMADNALRRGEVINPKSQPARNVVFYNRLVASHPRLESVVIPIRDGLSVARVRS